MGALLPLQTVPCDRCHAHGHAGVITLLAAIDRNRAIGRGNALPWHLPDDLKRFKALTLGKSVLMGRKTAQSLGRALPKRRNLVLTHSNRAPFAGMEVVGSLDDAVRLVGSEGLMVIGGGEVFALALPLSARMHLTCVETVVERADAFFPVFDLTRWREVGRERHPSDDAHAFAFEFVDYEVLG